MAFTESMLWNTDGTGDGPAGGYGRSRWAELLRSVFGNGVLKGEGDELAVTGSASPLTLATGAAIVDGIFGRNPVAEGIAVPTPSVGTTGHRLVLRVTWGNTQTLRPALLSNNDGVPLSTQVPPLTQNSGAQFDLPLARFDITTGGTIQNMIDERAYSDARGGMPAGMVIPFAGSAAPAGWMLCNGVAVSRATYAVLFATIGTTYGAGDGSTTFNLPNLQGRVPVGLDGGQAEFNALGKSGGAKAHTLGTSEMPSHAHTINSAGAHTHTTDSAGAHAHPLIGNPGGTAAGAASHIDEVHGGDGTNRGSTPTAGAHTHTAQSAGAHAHTAQASGGGAAHNNLQPYIALNYIIKH